MKRDSNSRTLFNQVTTFGITAKYPLVAVNKVKFDYFFEEVFIPGDLLVGGVVVVVL